jgi:hypothetical protein
LVSVGGGSTSGISTAVITYSKGMPSALAQPSTTATPAPVATWGGPHQLLVVTWGSDSCPLLPTSVHTSGPHRLVITTAAHGGGAYTSDLVATTSVVAVPGALDDTAPVQVDVDGTTITLGPRG